MSCVLTLFGQTSGHHWNDHASEWSRFVIVYFARARRRLIDGSDQWVVSLISFHVFANSDTSSSKLTLYFHFHLTVVVHSYFCMRFWKKFQNGTLFPFIFCFTVFVLRRIERSPVLRLRFGFFNNASKSGALKLKRNFQKREQDAENCTESNFF